VRKGSDGCRLPNSLTQSPGRAYQVSQAGQHRQQLRPGAVLMGGQRYPYPNLGVLATVTSLYPGDHPAAEAGHRDGDRVGPMFAQTASMTAGAPLGVAYSLHHCHPARGQVPVRSPGQLEHRSHGYAKSAQRSK
jgi:hypothetical protein